MTSVLHTRESSLRAMPGPRGLPLVGSVPAMLRMGVFEFVEQAWREYGDIFQIATGGRSRLIVVSSPEAAERILVGGVDNFYKGRGYDPIRPLLGNGLVTSTGDFWLRQRKLANPVFTRAGLRRLLPPMTRCVHEMLATWKTRCAAGTPFDLHAEMIALTQRIIGFTLFGLDLGGSAAETAKAVADCLHIAGERVNRGAMVVPLSVPTPANIRYKRALRTLDELVLGIIGAARRKTDGDESVTLLSMLMDARDADTGTGMDDRQLRDEVLTMFVAGHETSALVLAWAFYLLAGHPEVVERMAAEVAAVCPTDTPSFEQLEQLSYTRMVIDEVMRLRPPVWAQTRVNYEPDVLLGHPIPADSMLLLSSYFTHRHPKHWDDPEAFRPERFTPEAVQRRHRFAHYPFSAGPRACLGKRFAMYELTLAFALILPRFRVSVLPGQTIGLNVTATVAPDRPIMVRLTTPPAPAATPA